MKSRAEYDKLLKSLSENARKIEVNGLTVEVRDCADRQPGRPDPRSAASARLTRAQFAARRSELDPELWANEDHLFGPQDPQNYSCLLYTSISPASPPPRKKSFWPSWAWRPAAWTT